MSESHPLAPRQSVRLWTAFALMPVVCATLGFFGFPLLWYLGDHDGHLIDPDGAARGFALLTGFLALVVTAGGAIPVVLTLLERGPISVTKSIVAGVILGNGPFAFFLVAIVLPAALMHLAGGTMSQHLSPVSDLIAGTLRVVTIGSVLGGLSAIVFWFVGLR